MRCHAHTDFVLDSLDAVYQMTDKKTTRIVCAVDGNNQRLGKILSKVLGEDHVLIANRRYGWGPGLWSLLAKSVLEFEKRFRFGHFMTIDYDTLFIKPGADLEVLGMIDSPDIGLIGNHNLSNKHWEVAFHRERDNLSARLGGIPKSYVPGEGVQGGCFVLTRSGIEGLKRKRLLDSHWANAASFTTIADDHLVTLLIRAAGLRILDLPSSRFYIVWRSEKNLLALHKTDVKVFHPTKVRPEVKDRNVELRIRNFYRKLRGREPLI